MGLRSAALILTLVAAPVGAGARDAAPVGDEIPVDRLSLEMDPVDADVLFRKYPYDTSSFAVTVLGDGGSRLPGRVEVKGKSSRLVPKKGPLIKLAKPGLWHGQSRLSMNALATDPTMMREWLAWDLIHRLGMVSPEVRYTFLTINGRDEGLFLRIEWFGPRMFQRYGEAPGDLYDPDDSESCGDLYPQSLPVLDVCWAKLYPDGDFGPLAALIERIDAEPPATFDRFLAQSFDAQSLVNWIAVTVVTSNLTTYNNEYWPYYSSASRRWMVVPWDYDRSFGKNADPWQPYPGYVFNSNFQYWYPLELGAQNAIRDKIFKNPRLDRAVRDRIREIVDGRPDAAHPWRGWFAPEAMAARISRLEDVVRPLRARDQFLQSPAAQAAFEEEVVALRHYAAARAEYLRRAVLGQGAGVADAGEKRLAGAGRPVWIADGGGMLMAKVTPQGAGAGSVSARVIRGWPERVPPGQVREACVQRSWVLTGPARSSAEVAVEYLQEFAHTSEVGPAVPDESFLRLHALRDGQWWALPTTGNALSNTLTATVRFPDRGPLRLVACAPSGLDTASR